MRHRVFRGARRGRRQTGDVASERSRCARGCAAQAGGGGMSWQTEWKRLRRRIESLLDTGRFMFTTALAMRVDFYSATDDLI